MQNQQGNNSGVQEVILIVEPHPDDGALSMGGAISKFYENGIKLNSVVVFSDMRQDKRAIRRKESDSVWLQTLSGEVFYLDLPDEIFHKTYNDKLIIDNVSKSVFVQCIKGLDKLIKKISPNKVYFPIGIGGHFHHIIVNMCFDMIFEKYKEILFYFYEDYPYADLSRITYAKYIYRLWEKYSIQEEYQLIEGYIGMKKNLISKYKSQIEGKESDMEMKLEEYGKAISYEGIIKGHKLQSGKPYERFWKVI